jgi:hypothetical protein
MLFLLAVFYFVLGEEDSRLCFCFFMLRKKRGRNMYGIYAMAASGRMPHDYKQTNKQTGLIHGPAAAGADASCIYLE